MRLEEAIKALNCENIEIKYNNNNKLTDFDAQLVVACKNVEGTTVLTVGNFKLKI